jgi:hypothetical protein
VLSVSPRGPRRRAVKLVQEVGLKIKDAHGLPRVTHIPPPLALAIVKALRGEPYQ